jgi:1-deoxy-D-xylulose-5-phosphate synthase
LDGGFGEKIARHYADSAVRVKCYGLEKRFLDRYDASQLLESCRLRPQLLADDAVALLAQA